MHWRSHRQPNRWVGAGELSPAAVLTLLHTSGQQPCLLRTAAVMSLSYIVVYVVGLFPLTCYPG